DACGDLVFTLEGWGILVQRRGEFAAGRDRLREALALRERRLRDGQRPGGMSLATVRHLVGQADRLAGLPPERQRRSQEALAVLTDLRRQLDEGSLKPGRAAGELARGLAALKTLGDAFGQHELCYAGLEKAVAELYELQ